MFFESGIAELPVSAPWSGVLSAFRIGRSAEAFEQGHPLAKDAGWAGDGDVVLWTEVLLAVGRTRLAQRLLRRVAQDRERHWTLVIAGAHALAREGRFLAAERLLDREAARMDAPLAKALALAVRARLLAQMERESGARAHLEKLDRLPERDHAWVLHERGGVHFCLREWAAAAEIFAAVRARCPEWARPALHEARCHSARGEPDRALELLVTSSRAFPKLTALRFAHLGELVARDRWAEAVHEVDALLAEPPPPAETSGPADPESDPAAQVEALRGLRLRALWRLGNHEALRAALDPAKENDQYFAAALERGGPRRRLAVLPIVQERSMCVAASVAMVMRFHGHAADPAKLYREMAGNQGVAEWQLDRWIHARGWTAVDLPLEIGAVRWAVDQGLPLLATRASLLMSHMEVVAGYDDAIEELEGVDPAHGGPTLARYAGLAGSYTSLQVILPPGRAAGDCPVDQEATTCRLARRAAYAGEPDAARALLERVPADGPRARHLTLELGDTFRAQAEVVAAARALAADERVGPEERLRAALTLHGTPDGEGMKDLIDALLAELPRFHRGWFRLHDEERRGRWDRALRMTRMFVERASHIEAFWAMHATALRQTGHIAAARAAEAICLEISPLHLSVVLSPWALTSSAVDLAAEAERLAQARERHPLTPGIAEQRWKVDLELGDIDAGEARLKDAIRRMPLARGPRAALDAWYLAQGRPDLATPPPPSPPEEAAGGEVSSGANDLAERRARLIRALDQPAAKFETKPLLEALPATLPYPVAETIEWFLSPPVNELVHAPAARVLLPWVNKLMAGREWPPGARFVGAWLLEALGQRREAETAIDRLTGEDGFVPALYHLVGSAVGQRRFSHAGNGLARMLGMRPGNIDCWHWQSVFAQLIGDAELRAKAIVRLVELRPYCTATAQRRLVDLQSTGGLAAARAWLAENAARYPLAFRKLTEARFLLQEDRHAAALEELDSATRAAEPVAAWEIELNALFDLGDEAKLHARALEAATAHPEVAFFGRLAATGLRESDPARARELSMRAFLSDPLPEAFQDIIVASSDRTWQAIGMEVVDAVGDWRKRDEVIRAIARAMGSNISPGARRQFFTEVLERDASSAQALAELALAALDARRGDEVIRHVARFVDQAPDELNRLEYAAQLLIELQPKRAIELHERIFALTGRPDAIVQRGRVLRRFSVDQSVAEFRRALSIDPGNPVAIANLALSLNSPAWLYDHVVQALKYPVPTDTQFFLVAAVKIAWRAGKPLPVAWARQAALRIAHYRQHQDVYVDQDIHEDLQLPKMLAHWCRKRDDDLICDVQPDQLRRFMHYVEAYLEPWGWSRRWIPATSA